MKRRVEGLKARLLRLGSLAAAVMAGAVVIPFQIDAQVLINRENRAVRDEGDRFLELGSRQNKEGKTKEAIASWQKAIAHYRLVGDQPSISYVLALVADAYERLGGTTAAQDTFTRRIGYANTLQDPGAKISSLNNLAGLSLKKDDPATAAPLSNAALKLSRQYENNLGTADALKNSGLIAARYGEHMKAIKLYYESIPQRYPIRDMVGEGYTFIHSGDSHMAMDDYKSALRDYGCAHTIARMLRDYKLMAIAIDRLLYAYLEVPNFYRIEDLLQNRTSVALVLDDMATAIIAQRYLGDLYISFGNFPKAKLAYQQSLDFAATLRDSSAIRESYFRLQALERMQ